MRFLLFSLFFRRFCDRFGTVATVFVTILRLIWVYFDSHSGPFSNKMLRKSTFRELHYTEELIFVSKERDPVKKTFVFRCVLKQYKNDDFPIKNDDFMLTKC